jgi:hypothetical protein
MKKLKVIQIFSNGSVNFSYKTLNDSSILHFLEKDHKTFIFNLKNYKTKTNSGDILTYKNKYL